MYYLCICLTKMTNTISKFDYSICAFLLTCTWHTPWNLRDGAITNAIACIPENTVHFIVTASSPENHRVPYNHGTHFSLRPYDRACLMVRYLAERPVHQKIRYFSLIYFARGSRIHRLHRGIKDKDG